MVHFVNVGFGNLVAVRRIIAVIGAESSPVKRMVSEAKKDGRLIDATFGRRTRAVIVCDTNHVVLSPVLPETVAHRVELQYFSQTEGG